jgi:hypothetical protein
MFERTLLSREARPFGQASKGALPIGPVSVILDDEISAGKPLDMKKVNNQ